MKSDTPPVLGRGPTVTIQVTNDTIPGHAPTAGHVLHAEGTAVDPDGDAIVGITYRWLRGNTEIETGQDYASEPEDAGQTLKVEATATTDPTRSNPSSGTGTIDVTLATPSAPVANNMGIGGAVYVGQTLTGQYTYTDPDQDAEKGSLYQWYRADDATGTTNRIAIDGETALTHRVVAADQGKHLVFEVTPRSATGKPDTGNANSAVTTRPVTAALVATAVQTAQVLPVGQPAASFSPLTGVAGGQSPYVYEVDNDALPAGLSLNATTGAVTGTPSAATREAVNVVFRVKDANGTYASTTSTVSYTISGAAPVASNLRIVGRPIVGETVTVEFDFTDSDGDDEGDTTFNWCRNGVTCGIGNERSYTIQQADLGQQLTVQVTPQARTGVPKVGQMVSAATFPTAGTITAAEAAPVASNLRITGRHTVGSTLTITYVFSDDNGDAEGATTFNWCWRGVTCGKGNARTYTLTSADLGREMTVEVVPKSLTGTPDTGAVATVHSGVAVTNEAAPEARNLSISGELIVGQTLTGHYQFFDANGDAENGTELRWCVKGVDCNLGTGSTYVLKPEDAGKRIEFSVKPKALGTPNDTGTQQFVELAGGPMAYSTARIPMQNIGTGGIKAESKFTTHGFALDARPAGTVLPGAKLRVHHYCAGSRLEVWLDSPSTNFIEIYDNGCSGLATWETKEIPLPPAFIGKTLSGTWNVDVYMDDLGTGPHDDQRTDWVELVY